MKTLFIFNFVLCLFSASLVRALSSEEIEQVTYTCCSHGESVAETATSCAGVSRPEDIEPEQMDVCLAAVASCCEQQMKNKELCSAGMKLAAANKCSTVDSDTGKICCEECFVGRLTGISQSKIGCGEAPSPEYYSSFTALRKGAYHSCCLEAAEMRQ